ncbi:asparagine synthase (glutamine-hydrolyzing) [Conexibacter sp. JD483]|uniref:asparagine synthase (glutamine-hydrolyzing) n=1 Tax=unclassified Conexibacter TaxID=2627773 RepID=UPI00272306E2|nr:MULTISPECIES: asparagine synthase (glutamine-hydrolyzing) [unclassified Conexibacter]MDO8184246.1 asparagine synthase (glutamine-hydrolyzing) [Conexibacter sp. CPCC 205706]MDO8197238.1 asparagine synthase (glutamine-hydrolyzing) [Conexibacter sp. CPCC 205762]MDR9367447.1 asparagine synthase (glutamine-hydrolyzing) [Conexibacter sp. JD483]
MCGLAGIVRADRGSEVAEGALLRMARSIRHRGPDGYGLARGDGAGFVSTRLAIFDIPGGWQPMHDAERSSLLVYNGEVYNHPELRAALNRDGVATTTTSDTEVVLRLLERDGLATLDRLNGQFAFAWWQPRERRLTLVRDRFGVRPLHWALQGDGTIVFGSEAKALFASGEVAATPDLGGIDDVFTTWGPRAPRSPFAGVQQLPPGGLLVWEDGQIVAQRTWWEPAYEQDGQQPEDLAELLEDSVRLRLRADVPVGTYLSGGLDSSLITALAQRVSDHELRTFSVAFHDQHYDERGYQEQVAQTLGTRHHVVEVGPREIADAFPDVVWHAETPMIRTAPVPLSLLAQETRRQGITVVATGEGADELYWGYDLFKETALRTLHRQDPARAEALLDEIYPYVEGSAARRGPAWKRFFFEAGSDADPLFSHQTRIAATAAVKAFYTPETTAALAADDTQQRLRDSLPQAFERWSPLERAAYLEVTTLMSPYLLAAQGDRVAMAHGVEGRFPFLDHRVFAHSVRLAPERKLDGLREKAALRDLAASVLPAEIAQRTKQPYRSPEVAPFFGDHAPAWVQERLSDAALRDVGIFDPVRVGGLLRRCRAGKATGFREGMALVGVLSTQLWHERYCASADYPEETAAPRVSIDLSTAPTT